MVPSSNDFAAPCRPEGVTTVTISRREFLAGVGAAAATGAGVLLGGPAGAAPRISRVRDRAALAPATLTMWANHPEWVQQVATLVSEFESQNPSVKIQLIEKPGPSYPTLVTSALAAGSAPDIFGMSAGLTYIQIAKAGHLHNLTGKIDTSALLPSATSAMYVNNKVYALPLLGEYTTGMYWWKSTFAKYNLAPVQTWPEFTALCKKLMSNGQVPIEMASADGIMPSFFWTGLMTTVRGPDGVTAVAEGKAKLTDADFLAATDYFKSLVPYLAPGYASTSYVNGKADFAEGKTAMCMGGSADFTGFKDVNPKVDLGFFAFPHPQGSGMTAVNSGVDLLYGLNSTVKDPAQVAAAIKFFNFFLTPKIGSQVADTIELPDTKGARSNTPMQELIISQSANDAPEWFQFPQLTNMWSYSLDHIANMLLGSVSTKQFAAACQAQISK
jgi:raffinose/stachyose/melibiose transport system substrate-binding protein